MQVDHVLDRQQVVTDSIVFLHPVLAGTCQGGQSPRKLLGSQRLRSIRLWQLDFTNSTLGGTIDCRTHKVAVRQYCVDGFLYRRLD